MSTDIGQIITGAFFFGMRSCYYSTIPKGEAKLTHILRKGDIIFYRKYHKLTHNSGFIHLAEKVSPTFRTQNNRVNISTVTQWQIGKRLCIVLHPSEHGVGRKS